jgi:MFS family permease
MPARQAFVVEMVDRREDLGNAIAINSSMVHTARLVGPALAGLLIGAVGEGYCFLLDGISYVGVVISLLMMRVAPTGAAASRRRVAHELRDGWRYVSGFAPVRSILLMLVLISVVGMPYSVLMPVFASDILHGGAHAYGILMAASGAGALAGAIDLARRKSVLGLGRRIAVDSGLFAVALIVFGLSRDFWLSIAVLPIAGFGMMQQLASSNTIIQTIVDDDKRGRVMAFYAMAFIGTMPFGNLLAGTMGSMIGAPLTVVFGGAVCLAGSVCFARSLPRIRELVRPIYVRLGILPEVAAGIQQASSVDS